MVSLCGRGFDSLQLHPISKKQLIFNCFFLFLSHNRTIRFTIYFCFHNSLKHLTISKFSVKAVYKQKYMIVLIGVADISNRKY